MNADVPTLLLMVIMSSVVMAGALLLLQGSRRQDGLAHWAGALVLGAAGYALFLLHGRVPAFVSTVPANALVSSMLAVMVAAVQCFQGRTPHWQRLVLAPVLMAVLMSLFLDSLSARVLLSNLLMAVQVLWLLWCLHRGGDQRTSGRGAQLLTAGLVLEAGVLLLRSGSAALFAQHSASILQGNTVQTLTFMTANIGMLVTSVGFVFMGKDRADQLNRRLAAQDELTGLANRRAILAALEREVARSLRTPAPLALMMVDVDHFKQVNDRHGHLAGDAVLRSVCGTLVQRVRTQDSVGRYGGEEFLVLLPGTSRDGAALLAGELCVAVQATPCLWNGESIRVTVSIGVYGGFLQPHDHADRLLHAADSALYRAKDAGRNRVEVAPERAPAVHPSVPPVPHAGAQPGKALQEALPPAD